jgi:hypothetical protein
MAAFDLDPAKEDALAFGSRTHQRLRVMLSTSMGASSSTLISGEDSDIRSSMEAAQLEALEEELFNEVGLACVHRGVIDACILMTDPSRGVQTPEW